jgi:hypothetical protein
MIHECDPAVARRSRAVPVRAFSVVCMCAVTKFFFGYGYWARSARTRLVQQQQVAETPPDHPPLIRWDPRVRSPSPAARAQRCVSADQHSSW